VANFNLICPVRRKKRGKGRKEVNNKKRHCAGQFSLRWPARRKKEREDSKIAYNITRKENKKEASIQFTILKELGRVTLTRTYQLNNP